MFFHHRDMYEFYKILVTKELPANSLFENLKDRYTDYENRSHAREESFFYFSEITWINSKGEEIREERNIPTSSFIAGFFMLGIGVFFSIRIHNTPNLTPARYNSAIIIVCFMFVFSLLFFSISYATSERSQRNNIIHETKKTLNTIIKYKKNDAAFFIDAINYASEGNAYVPDDYLNKLKKELNLINEKNEIEQVSSSIALESK